MSESPSLSEANTNGRRTQTPVTPPSIAVEIFDSLLGFAIMSFGNMNDIGRGPTFSSRELNARQVSNKRRENFIRAVGGDPLDPTQPPNNLRRFDVENAIVILVPKDAVDLTSLVKKPKSSNEPMEVKHIAWLTKNDSRCTVANGAGRIDYVQNVLCRQEVDTVRLQLDILRKNLRRGGLETRVTEARAAIERANENLKKESNWMVAVYDLDAIERSENATQIKLALASNIPAYQAPDNEDEALQVILMNISPLPKENWLKELDNNNTRISLGPKRLAPIIRNQRLILAIINSHRYARYWEDNIKATQYYDWRVAVSPFIEALLDQGTAVLDYLASDIDAPAEGDPVSLDSILSEVNPTPNILTDSFFALVSRCYAKHLYAHRASYGVSSHMQEKGFVTYEGAFKEYVEDLLAQIPDWITGRLLALRDTPQHTKAEKVLTGLPARLRYALTSSLFNSTSIGLRLPTATPILCRSFLLDMGTYLHGLSSPIMEVFRMLDPMFPGVLQHSTSSTLFKDQPTAMLEQFITDHRPHTEAKEVLNELLSIIFRHRTFALVKINSLNNTNPPKNPARSELTGRQAAKPSVLGSQPEAATNGIFSTQHNAIQSLLKGWRHATINNLDSSLDRKLKPSLIPSLDQEVLVALPHGDMLLSILTATSHRWADCKTSQTATAARTVSSHALTTLWFHNNHHIHYLRENEVWNMREDIERYLDDSLTLWVGFWDEVSEQPDGGMPALSQSKISIPRKLQLESMGKEMQKKMREGVLALVRILRRKEMGAIPVEDESGKRTIFIARNVYDAAENLFKELGISSLCAQTMYTEPSRDRVAIVESRTRSDMLEFLELPAEFQRATDDDMSAYYQSMDIETINNTDIFGEGSLKVQAKVMADHKKRLKRIGRGYDRKEFTSTEFISARRLLEDETLITIGDKDPKLSGDDNSDWEKESFRPEEDGSGGEEDVQSEQEGSPVPPRRSRRFAQEPDDAFGEDEVQEDQIAAQSSSAEPEQPDDLATQKGPGRRGASEEIVVSSSPGNSWKTTRTRLFKRRACTPTSESEEQASPKRSKVASDESDITPEGTNQNASPPGAPITRRIGLSPMETDDDTSLPPTFPDATQAKPSALTHQSSPEYEPGWTEENWQAFAKLPEPGGGGGESSTSSDSFLKSALEPGDVSPAPLIVKKINTRSGKLMIMRKKK